MSIRALARRHLLAGACLVGPTLDVPCLAADTAQVSAAASTPTIHLRARPRPRSSALDHAYASLRTGKLEDARQAYSEVLRGDPGNADALLGLAAIARRRNENGSAEAFYLRILETDPRDVDAHAGLIDLLAESQPIHSENRLRHLLTEHAQAAALHFTLGNLYASQNRWNEAQQAYFQAFTFDPENADYLFNLAVSLDHLRQKAQSLRFYRMALAAARDSAAFDPGEVQRRLLELQP